MALANFTKPGAYFFSLNRQRFSHWQQVNKYLPALHHQHHAVLVSNYSDVAERVSVQHQQIGQLALLNGADFLVQPNSFGGPAGGGLNRLHWRHAPFHQQFNFAGIISVDKSTGIGTRNYFYTGSQGLVHTLLMNLH